MVCIATSLIGWHHAEKHPMIRQPTLQPFFVLRLSSVVVCAKKLKANKIDYEESGGIAVTHC